MKKLYSEEFVTSEDKSLIKHCHFLRHLYENDKKEQHQQIFKAICDSLRRSLNTTKVLGLGLNKEEDTVGIFIYDIEATEGSFYDQKFDEEKGKHYILVA